MISTHCRLEGWCQAADREYALMKQEIGDTLVAYARRVYPRLARNPVVWEVATPRTDERFTRRPNGAVGGFKQTLANANQCAVPHDLGVSGFWLVGDTTWPGLGTVACVLGSRIVADRAVRLHRKLNRGRAHVAQPPQEASHELSVTC